MLIRDIIPSVRHSFGDGEPSPRRSFNEGRSEPKIPKYTTKKALAFFTILFLILQFFAGFEFLFPIKEAKADGTNLVTNGDMETGNPPEGLKAFGTPGTFERSSTHHTGSYSAHIVTDAANEGFIYTGKWETKFSGGMGDAGNFSTVPTIWNGSWVAGFSNMAGGQIWKETNGVWTQINTSGFGKGIRDILSLSVIGGDLYVATGDLPSVWKYSGAGTSWTQLGTDYFGDSINVAYIQFVIEYRSEIYAGVSSRDFLHPESLGGVYKWNGAAWVLISELGFGVNSTTISDNAVVLNDKLYVGDRRGASLSVGTNVFEYDGSSWRKVGADGFGDSNNIASVLTTYNGNLIVGTTAGAINSGGEVWSWDGSTWSQINTDGFGVGSDIWVIRLISDGTKLYAMTYFSVYLYDGGTSWIDITPTAWDNISTYPGVAVMINDGQLCFGGWVGDLQCLTPLPSLLANHRYKLSFWTNLTSTASNINGFINTSAGAICDPGNISTTGSWLYRESECVIPAGAVDQRLTFKGATGVSEFYIDDVSIYELPLAPTIGIPQAQSVSSIRWNFADNSDNETGFKIYTETNTVATSSATAGLTYLDETGLSTNTQYTGRYVVAYNSYGNSASSSVASSIYTFASTPTNLSAVAGLTTMDLSVDALPNATAGSSGYYFNSTNGTNSGWITTNSWGDLDLTCGTSYTYSVIYKNGDGTETASDTLTKSTNACPGNGPLPPSNAYANWLAQSAKATSTNSLPLTSGSGTLAPTTPLPSVSGPQAITPSAFTKDLKFGQVVSDVKRLQVFLNQDPDTKVAKSGVGSPGKETNIFGYLTRAAVIKFQEKYTQDILAPWNLIKGTGFVGRTTKAKINRMLGL